MMVNSSDLPLFPLGMVLFPSGRMKLRIFEPRYVNLVKFCMKEQQGFGVVGIAQGNEAGEPAEPFSVGVIVHIVDFETLPDGLLGLTIEAHQRFEIKRRWIDEERLQHAEIELLPDYADESLDSSHHELQRLIQGVFPELEAEYGYDTPQFDNAAWVLGRLAEVLPLPLAYKAELLQCSSAAEALDDLQSRLQRADQQSASRHF